MYKITFWKNGDVFTKMVDARSRNDSISQVMDIDGYISKIEKVELNDSVQSSIQKKRHRV